VLVADEEEPTAHPEQRRGLGADEPRDALRVALLVEGRGEAREPRTDAGRLLDPVEQTRIVDSRRCLAGNPVDDRERCGIEAGGLMKSDRHRAEPHAPRLQRDDRHVVLLGLLEQLACLEARLAVAAQPDGLAGAQVLFEEHLPPVEVLLREPLDDVRRRSAVRHGDVRLPPVATAIDGALIARHQLDRQPTESAEHVRQRETRARLLRDLDERIGDALLALERSEPLGDVRGAAARGSLGSVRTSWYVAMSPLVHGPRTAPCVQEWFRRGTGTRCARRHRLAAGSMDDDAGRWASTGTIQRKERHAFVTREALLVALAFGRRVDSDRRRMSAPEANAEQIRYWNEAAGPKWV